MRLSFESGVRCLAFMAFGLVLALHDTAAAQSGVGQACGGAAGPNCSVGLLCDTRQRFGIRLEVGEQFVVRSESHCNSDLIKDFRKS